MSRLLLTGMVALTIAGSVSAQQLMTTNDGIVFSQEFETNTDGWFDQSNGWSGSVTRVPSGTNGIASASGDYHAIFTQTNAAGGLTGPFTRFDGYRDTFPGTYSARTAIYLDTNWTAGEGFDYSVASSGSDGNHQRDFIFHVTQDTSTGNLLVGGSNNTNFDPREDLETINNYLVGTSGWYTFEHLFRDDGGVLAVDLNLYDASGMLLFTETRSSLLDTIPAEVGGNRYGWFTNIDIAGGIAVDLAGADFTPVPEPTTLALFSIVGLVGAGAGAARRRRAKGRQSTV